MAWMDPAVSGRRSGGQRIREQRPEWPCVGSGGSKKGSLKRFAEAKPARRAGEVRIVRYQLGA